MMDTQLRTVCFGIAASAGAVSLASILFSPVRLILFPATIIVGATAALLFLRMRFGRAYWQGIHALNREMGDDEKTFADPEWGLFGRRAGSPALLWLRAVLFVGIFPAVLLQHWIGVDVVMLWFWGGFVAIELSLMHAALSRSDEG